MELSHDRKKKVVLTKRCVMGGGQVGVVPVVKILMVYVTEFLHFHLLLSLL